MQPTDQVALVDPPKDAPELPENDGVEWVADWFQSQVGNSYNGDAIHYSIQLDGTADGSVVPFIVPSSVTGLVDSDFHISVVGYAEPITAHLSIQVGPFNLHFLDLFFHGH